MKVALVIGRCPKCPWYSEMQGCMHNEGPAGIVENDYIVNPNCPLPDYVDVEKLQKERDELAKLLKERTGYYYERGVPHQSQHPYCQCRECTDKRCYDALSKIKGEI